MAKLRGDLLTLRVQHHSSGTVNEIIAGTTSFSFDSSSEFLETTDQADGLNTSGIAGKNTRTISGDYFATTTLDNFDNLYAHQAAGAVIEWAIYLNGSVHLNGEAVITSLGLSAGTSAELVTGSYTLNVTGTVTAS